MSHSSSFPLPPPPAKHAPRQINLCPAAPSGKEGEAHCASERSGLFWEGGYYDVHEINFKLPLCRSLLALPRGRKGALSYPPAARNFFYYSMFQGNNGLDRERNGEWYAFRVRHLRCKRTVKGHGTCSIPPTASEFVNPTTKYI